MEKADIVVIGAGIAGLTAAYELKRNNKKVIVLEKENYLGGRMSTKIIDGITLNLGAQFITPFYKNMNSYIKEFNLKVEKLNIGRLAIKRNGLLFSFNGENPLSLLFFKGLSLKNKVKLLFGLLTKLIEARKIDIYDLKTYLSFDEKNIYDDLINKIGRDGFDYFIDPMLNSIFGYSSKDFSKALFLAVLKKLFNSKLYSFENGINQLVLKLANKSDIRINFEVTKVKKFDKKVLVTTRTKGNKEIVFEANKVIIAIPGNKVLKILDDPSPEEKEFFSQIEYSKIGYIFFKNNEPIIKDAETVWFSIKENKYFFGFGYFRKTKNTFYYSAELRENAIRELNNCRDKRNLLINFIEQQLGIKNFKVIYVQLWDSAVPKFKPGYLTAMNKFKQTMNKNNTIFYCGDYLENPSTEGALTSGLKTADFINKNCK